jgi:hypothetical protein
MSELPQADSADTDAVQMALQAAHTLWSRGDTTESLRWLKRAAESASDEGADLRSLQLAKAAAELRARLFPSASDAPPPAPARVPTQRDLTGIRPVSPHEALPEREPQPPSALSSSAHAVSAHAASGLEASDASGERPEDSSPNAARSPSSAPQYVVHRPREQQRQLMGLSPSNLETARQHNGPSSYSSVPSWSAGSERRTSAPPPLPHSLDDYEELDAEPIADSDSNASAGWAATAAPTWRPPERGREAGSDSSPRVATLPPPSFQSAALSSSPPPLPELSAFAEEDGDPMRPEQQTVVLPPQEEQGPDPDFFTAPASSGGGDSGSYSWTSEVSRSGAWLPNPAAEPSSPAADSAAPAKLTARVHHQAVRVAFAPDPRSPGQYLVRPLREGERAPAGERVALLVALEPGVPLV